MSKLTLQSIGIGIVTQRLDEIHQKLNFIMTDILQVKETFEQALELTEGTLISIGLKKHIKVYEEVLNCFVWNHIMTPGDAGAVRTNSDGVYIFNSIFILYFIFVACVYKN